MIRNLFNQIKENKPIFLFLGCYIITRVMKYYNEKESFDAINQNYQDINDEEKKIISQLQIYPDNFSRSYASNKKEKILLIISGFRDTPKMWENLETILKENKIDYVIPRINGFGRTYFQYNIKWNDWVVSIMEHLSVLQNLYHEVDILGFSTGCNIGFYLSQFKWNCKINNMIFCSPNFVVNSGDKIYKSLLVLPILSEFFQIVYPVCHRPYESRLKKSNKSSKKKKFIFYEKNFPLISAIEMWKFQDILPTNCCAKKIVIVKANNDKLIGKISLQKEIIEKITKENIDVIHIPSDPNSKILVGHNITNSSEEILFDFYNQIEILIKR